jgi:hypothetical protein
MDERPDNSSRPLMTATRLVQHINEVTGVPLKPSSFAKLQTKKESRLEPDFFYGKTALFKPERGVEWAIKRLRTKTPQKLNLG